MRRRAAEALGSGLAAGTSRAPRTLAEVAFARLQGAIVSGELEPDTRLPILELADLLGMSPMPIREALRRLATQGLVELVPHRGARVATLSIDDLRETYELRLVLEPLAIARAAEQFGPEHTARARAHLERWATATKMKQHAEARSQHTEFHFALYSVARSEWLLRLITPVWENSERYRLISVPLRGGLESRKGEHERILAACDAHDPDAAAAELHDHLALTANHVAKRMGHGPLFALATPDHAAAAIRFASLPLQTPEPQHLTKENR